MRFCSFCSRFRDHSAYVMQLHICMHIPSQVIRNVASFSDDHSLRTSICLKFKLSLGAITYELLLQVTLRFLKHRMTSYHYKSDESHCSPPFLHEKPANRKDAENAHETRAFFFWRSLCEPCVSDAAVAVTRVALVSLCAPPPWSIVPPSILLSPAGLRRAHSPLLLPLELGSTRGQQEATGERSSWPWRARSMSAVDVLRSCVAGVLSPIVGRARWNFAAGRPPLT
jgi:hypothetical protein